jgi:hypothetical protein
MGDPELGLRGGRALAWGICAVEPPIPHVPPARRARRHRRLTGLCGVLLFACLFMPAMEGCHQPVMPYEVPAFLPPYVYGLLFALIAMSTTARGIDLGYIALRVLGVIMVLGSVVLVVMVPPVGVVELIVATLLAVPATSASREARIAVNGIELGVVCVMWFGFLAITGGALLGVYLSLASALGLLAGCVAWRRALGGGDEVAMPRARLARHRECILGS